MSRATIQIRQWYAQRGMGRRRRGSRKKGRKGGLRQRRRRRKELGVFSALQEAVVNHDMQHNWLPWLRKQYVIFNKPELVNSRRLMTRCCLFGIYWEGEVMREEKKE